MKEKERGKNIIEFDTLSERDWLSCYEERESVWAKEMEVKEYDK